MDFGTTIRWAQEVEDIAGDIYHLLAERSAGRPADAATFRRLEQEEREHAKRLGMLGSMYLKDPKSFRGVSLDIANLQDLVFEAKAFHDAVVEGKLDLAVTLERLVDLEERFAVTHAEVVARNADPGLKQLFSMLATQDREHLRLLRTRSVMPR